MAQYYVATTGNDTTGDGSSGNPYASPGKAASVATASGDLIWLKAGTYTLSTSTVNAAGGPVSLAQGVKLEGYQTTPGDQAARPVISAGAIGSVSLVKMVASFNVRPCALVNIELNGNSQASVRGLDCSGISYVVNVYQCIARNCTNGGFTGNINCQIAQCAAVGCNIGFDTWLSANGCTAQACTSDGFSNVKAVVFCRSSGNGGNGFNFVGTVGWLATNCTAHGNTSHGFSASFDIGAIISCVSTSNSGWGYSIGAANCGLTFINSAYRNNTLGGIRYTITNPVNAIALSADPYTSAAGNNFALNNATGGGASLRGIAATAPGDAATRYQDVGMYQHAGAAGGFPLSRVLN